jgi:hypothetical protein
MMKGINGKCSITTTYNDHHVADNTSRNTVGLLF